MANVLSGYNCPSHSPWLREVVVAQVLYRAGDSLKQHWLLTQRLGSHGWPANHERAYHEGTASRGDRYWPIRAATYCLWISNSREDWPDRNKLSMKHSHAKKLRPHKKENLWVPELPWALNRFPVPEPLHQHSTPNPPFLCMAWENLYSLQL